MSENPKSEVRNPKSEMRPAKFGFPLVLALLALEVAGCDRLFTWGKPSESSLDRDPIALQVVPRSNRDVADLSADDIVRVMQRVGFTDEQILQLGPDLHTALLKSGAAGIVNGKRTEAVFAVNGGHLFIRSRSGADFVYNLASGKFGLPNLGSSADPRS